MRKRCYKCKCLEEESPKQFQQRTRYNFKSRYYCGSCLKEISKNNPDLLKDRNTPIVKKLTPAQLRSIEKQKKKEELKKEISKFEDVLRIEVEVENKKRKDFYFKKNHSESGKKGRRRYSNTDKGKAAESINNYNHRIRKMKKNNLCYGISEEERIAIGRFYRKKPEGYEVDHIIPVSKGGRHELSNLQYLTPEENRKKSAKELTEKMKIDCFNASPFTPMPEGFDYIEVSTKKRGRGSKFKSIRKLVEK